MKYIFAVILMILLPCLAESATSITRHAITWDFADDETCGTYANGDPWCIGPVSITMITPMSSSVDGRVQHGSMLNPVGFTQGFDSAQTELAYSAALNVGRPSGADISAANPIVVTSGTIISSQTYAGVNLRPQLIDASALTIVTDAPAAGSFRPPYSGTDKVSYHNVSDIQWQLLPKLPKAGIAATPPLATLLDYVDRIWFDPAGGTDSARNSRPFNNLPDYAASQSLKTGDIALSLLLDYTQEELMPLMVAFLQIGIDLYGVAENFGNILTTTTQGGLWMGGGGNGIGKKWPVVFAGLMFNDQNILKYANGANYPIFQEEQQFFYVSQADVDQERLIEDGWPREPYTTDMIGVPEWGDSHWLRPDKDGSNWDASYRDIVSPSILGHALAAIILYSKPLWNWPAFFDYEDRWQTYREENLGAGALTYESQFARSMWIVYRNNYRASRYAVRAVTNE